MKKVVSVALALVMMFALSAVAFAANADTTFNIPVYYKSENAGSNKPAVDFNFAIGTCTGVTGSTATVSDAPAFAADGKAAVHFEGGVGKDEEPGFAVFTILGSSLKKAGIFTYDITQSDPTPDYAGLEYDKEVAELTVYVIQGEKEGEFTVEVKVVYDEGKISGGTYNKETQKYEKTQDTTPIGDTFTNTYKAAANDPESSDKNGFTVGKTVTGKLGDKSEKFTITVSFASAKQVAPNGIAYKVLDGESKEKTEYVAMTYSGTDKLYKGSKVIELKHGETFSFDNIPYGVTYEVVESDYTGEGYDAPVYAIDGSEVDDCAGTVAAASIDVGITNDYDTEVDTGVVFDVLPYVLILAFVVAACAMIILKKRKAEDY